MKRVVVVSDESKERVMVEERRREKGIERGENRRRDEVRNSERQGEITKILNSSRCR